MRAISKLKGYKKEWNWAIVTISLLLPNKVILKNDFYRMN